MRPLAVVTLALFALAAAPFVVEQQDATSVRTKERHREALPPVSAGPNDIPDVLSAVAASHEAFYVEQQRMIDEYLAWQHEQDVQEWIRTHPPVQQQQQQQQQQRSSSGGAVITGEDVWSRLAQCECGGNPSCNTGNGFYGTFQFLPSTWQSVGGTGLPSDASYEEQLMRAQILQARAGWGQWPECSRKLGLR